MVVRQARNARKAERGEETVDLVEAEDGRERTTLGRADEVKGGPGALQGVDKEELDGGEGDGDGARGDALFIDEIKEVVSEFLLGDEVGGFAIVGGELLHGEEVDGLGLGGEAAELHVVLHALT